MQAVRRGWLMADSEIKDIPLFFLRGRYKASWAGTQDDQRAANIMDDLLMRSDWCS